MLAGHDTTANTMSWALFELAKHPDVQEKLRAEIRKKEDQIRARGKGNFSLSDLEAMPYVLAVIKVSAFDYADKIIIELPSFIRRS